MTNRSPIGSVGRPRPIDRPATVHGNRSRVLYVTRNRLDVNGRDLCDTSDRDRQRKRESDGGEDDPGSRNEYGVRASIGPWESTLATSRRLFDARGEHYEVRLFLGEGTRGKDGDRFDVLARLAIQTLPVGRV